MKKWMNARIKWLSANEGGRMTLIPIVSDERNDNKYCPIITIANMIPNGNSWSAVIYVKKYIDKYESIARISYLSDDAPFESLQEEIEFNLYEGNRLVATGQFLDNL